MVDKPSQVKVTVLIRELNSRISYVSTLGVVVISTTGEHTSSTVERKHKEDKG
jgi:hypothetical protein